MVEKSTPNDQKQRPSNPDDFSSREFLKGKDLSQAEMIGRPAVPIGLKDRTSDIEFMQIDCDYYTKFSSDKQMDEPIIRMFGVTEAGNSVCAHVHNFTAYFYMHVCEPNVNLDPGICEALIERMNK